MKNMRSNVLKLSVLLAILATNGAFGWSFTVTNRTNQTKQVNATYASAWAFGKCFSCCDDNVAIAPGSTATIDAKGCLLTSINTPGATSFISSGTLTKTSFVIVEYNGLYKVLDYKKWIQYGF